MLNNLAEQVVYRNIDTNEIWIRDKQEFLSLVDKEKYPEVSQDFRFELIERED